MPVIAVLLRPLWGLHWLESMRAVASLPMLGALERFCCKPTGLEDVVLCCLRSEVTLPGLCEVEPSGSCATGDQYTRLQLYGPT
jgi:hypothetical protein